MSSRLQIARVGALHCCYEPETGFLALLNSVAARAWHGLSEGRHLDEVIDEMSLRYGAPREQVRADMAGLMGALEAAGCRAAAAATSASAGSQGALPAPTTESLTAIGLFGRADGAAVEIRCSDPAMGRLLEGVLAPLSRVDALPRTLRHSMSILIDGEADAFSVWQDDTIVAQQVARSWARRAVLKTLLCEAWCPFEASAVLHASAVERDGRAVVLAGASGSGKSTLTATLVADGAGYIGDDLLPLDRDGLGIGTFPVGLSVKSGSWSVVAPSFPWLASLTVYEPRRLQVRYLDLLDRCPDPTAVTRVGCIVFPQFSPNATPKLERIAPHETLAGLLRTGSTCERGTALGLASLCHNVPAWRLEYGSLDEAVAIVRRLLERP